MIIFSTDAKNIRVVRNQKEMVVKLDSDKIYTPIKIASAMNSIYHYYTDDEMDLILHECLVGNNAEHVYDVVNYFFNVVQQ